MSKKLKRGFGARLGGIETFLNLKTAFDDWMRKRQWEKEKLVYGETQATRRAEMGQRGATERALIAKGYELGGRTPTAPGAPSGFAERYPAERYPGISALTAGVPPERVVSTALAGGVDISRWQRLPTVTPPGARVAGGTIDVPGGTQRYTMPEANWGGFWTAVARDPKFKKKGIDLKGENRYLRKIWPSLAPRYNIPITYDEYLSGVSAEGVPEAQTKPVQQLVSEYSNPNTTPERRTQIRLELQGQGYPVVIR